MTDVIPVMRPWFDTRDEWAVLKTLRSGWVAQGPQVAAFEQEFADAVGAAHAVALTSATAALELALLLHDVGPGDEVVVPSLSFIATANAVRRVGATVVFADVEPEFGLVTAKTVLDRVTPRTAAVIAVHQAGVPLDIEPITAALTVRGIPLIEDAACAAGSWYVDRPVGHAAHLAAWSFHPRKILTTGEGGMLTMQDGDLATRARRLREHGSTLSASDRHRLPSHARERYVEPGFNLRMTDLQAALGRSQLERLPAVVTERREMAEWYAANLKGVAGVHLVHDPPWGRTNVQSLWLRVDSAAGVDREDVMSRLFDKGIGTRRGVMAAHLEPAYSTTPHEPLPVSEWLTSSTLILPLFHGLHRETVDRICDELLNALGACDPTGGCLGC